MTRAALEAIKEHAKLYASDKYVYGAYDNTPREGFIANFHHIEAMAHNALITMEKAALTQQPEQRK